MKAETVSQRLVLRDLEILKSEKLIFFTLIVLC